MKFMSEIILCTLHVWHSNHGNHTSTLAVGVPLVGENFLNEFHKYVWSHAFSSAMRYG